MQKSLTLLFGGHASDTSSDAAPEITQDKMRWWNKTLMCLFLVKLPGLANDANGLHGSEIIMLPELKKIYSLVWSSKHTVLSIIINNISTWNKQRAVIKNYFVLITNYQFDISDWRNILFLCIWKLRLNLKIISY